MLQRGNMIYVRLLHRIDKNVPISSILKTSETIHTPKGNV